jgi:hypothetical protein
MLVYSNDKKEEVEVSGKEIRFKWNYKEEVGYLLENFGENYTYWTYNECICLITDTQEEMEVKLENCGADSDTIQDLTNKYFKN